MVYASVIFSYAAFIDSGDLLAFLLICLLGGAALSADLAIPSSIQADLVDIETLRSGKRKTATFFSFWSIATKGSVALSSGFGPESSTFAIDSGDVINLVYHHPVPHSQDSYLDGYRLKDNSGNIIVEEIGLDSTGPVSSYGIEPCPIFTDLNNSKLEGFLKIYPNPAKDLINIKTDLKVNYFTISNLLGELVISRKNHLKNIDISNLPPNIYFIRFFVGDQQIIKKLVVN